jgi:hypothetical protein
MININIEGLSYHSNVQEVKRNPKRNSQERRYFKFPGLFALSLAPAPIPGSGDSHDDLQKLTSPNATSPNALNLPQAPQGAPQGLPADEEKAILGDKAEAEIAVLRNLSGKAVGGGAGTVTSAGNAESSNAASSENTGAESMKSILLDHQYHPVSESQGASSHGETQKSNAQNNELGSSDNIGNAQSGSSQFNGKFPQVGGFSLQAVVDNVDKLSGADNVDKTLSGNNADSIINAYTMNLNGNTVDSNLNSPGARSHSPLLTNNVNREINYSPSLDSVTSSVGMMSIASCPAHLNSSLLAEQHSNSMEHLHSILPGGSLLPGNSSILPGSSSVSSDLEGFGRVNEVLKFGESPRSNALGDGLGDGFSGDGLDGRPEKSAESSKRGLQRAASSDAAFDHLNAGKNGTRGTESQERSRNDNINRNNWNINSNTQNNDNAQNANSNPNVLGVFPLRSNNTNNTSNNNEYNSAVGSATSSAASAMSSLISPLVNPVINPLIKEFNSNLILKEGKFILNNCQLQNSARRLTFWIK